MRYLKSLLLGLALGAGSILIHNLYPPIGLVIAIAASSFGIWSAGRLWGRRSYRFFVAIIWGLVLLRAGLPGLNEEYLIQGDWIGVSLINFGFIAIIIAIITPI